MSRVTPPFAIYKPHNSLYKILGAKIPIGVSLRKLRVYCNEPWLLQSALLVYLFGGESGNDCNILLSGLVVGHGCTYDWNFHFLNITKPTHLMHMLLLYFSCLGYANDICIFFLTHVSVDFSIYVCMNLIEMCCWFNHHFGLLVHLPSSL